VQSNEFINSKNWIKGKFQWQEGYGVFSYSQSHIDSVINYIQNQEIHHQKKTFKPEYMALLEKFEVPFEERYLFDFIEQ
jgi:putative transposase